jgi:hypothetical protein
MEKRLKPEDEITIKRWKDNDYLAIYLKVLNEYRGINVGDVLIKKSKTTGDVVNMSGTCPIPIKYKVVYIDEDIGVLWLKQISVRGGLGKKLYPITNFSPTSFKFEIDPEKIEAEILGIKYDPRINYKRMRDINPNYGKENE